MTRTDIVHVVEQLIPKGEAVGTIDVQTAHRILAEIDFLRATLDSTRTELTVTRRQLAHCRIDRAVDRAVDRLEQSRPSRWWRR